MHAKRNIFMSKVPCSGCGKYRHMPALISGAVIQCVNGVNETIHQLDYFEQLEQVSCIINLCAETEAQVVNNFGFASIF